MKKILVRVEKGGLLREFVELRYQNRYHPEKDPGMKECIAQELLKKTTFLNFEKFFWAERQKARWRRQSSSPGTRVKAVGDEEAVEVDAAVVEDAADSSDRTMTTVVMVGNDQTTETFTAQQRIKVQKDLRFYRSVMSSIMYKVAPLLREYPINHSRIMYNIKPIQTVGETSNMPENAAALQGMNNYVIMTSKVDF